MCLLKYVCVAEWTKALDCKSKNYIAGSNPATYSKKIKNMTEEVKQYLWTEFKINNLPKYYKYFDTWIENLTENQILYYNAIVKVKKSICKLKLWHGF